MSLPILDSPEQRGWIKQNPSLSLIMAFMFVIAMMAGFIVHLYAQKDEAIRLKDAELKAERDKFEKHLIDARKDDRDALRYWRDLNQYAKELGKEADQAPSKNND